MPKKPKIKFPCDYPIKVIGRASDDFEARVMAAVNPHLDKPYEGKVESRDSKEGNYVSLTLTIRATSEKQLKALFEDLKKDDDIMMVL